MKKLMFIVALGITAVSVFADEAVGAATGDGGLQATKSAGGGYGGLLMMAAMFAILYFLILRPQQKQQKQVKSMQESLKIKDEVITNGGIVGRVVNINKEKDLVVVQVDDNTKLKIRRNAIAGVLSTNAEKQES